MWRAVVSVQGIGRLALRRVHRHKMDIASFNPSGVGLAGFHQRYRSRFRSFADSGQRRSGAWGQGSSTDGDRRLDRISEYPLSYPELRSYAPSAFRFAASAGDLLPDFFPLPPLIRSATVVFSRILAAASRTARKTS